MGSEVHSMALICREVDPEERAEIARLARSRAEEARLVERAKIVELALQGRFLVEIARELGVREGTVSKWARRFDLEGVEGLADKPRSGCPGVYTREEIAVVIATALRRPGDLGQAFACWTLDRLEVYLNEMEGIAIKRTRIAEVLAKEGLRWRQAETWYGERVDPDFAEKRGRSSACTKTRPKRA